MFPCGTRVSAISRRPHRVSPAPAAPGNSFPRSHSRARGDKPDPAAKNAAGEVSRKSNRPIEGLKVGRVLRGKVNRSVEKLLDPVPHGAEAGAILPFSWTQPCTNVTAAFRQLQTTPTTTPPSNQNRFTLQATTQLFYDRPAFAQSKIHYDLFRHGSIGICRSQSRARTGRARPHGESAAETERGSARAGRCPIRIR